jgi:hypothetical protein
MVECRSVRPPFYRTLYRTKKPLYAEIIEVYYNILDSNTVRVFHTMKCRYIHKFLLKMSRRRQKNAG